MGTLTGRHVGLPQARAQGLAVGDKVDIGRDRPRPSPGTATPCSSYIGGGNQSIIRHRRPLHQADGGRRGHVAAVLPPLAPRQTIDSAVVACCWDLGVLGEGARQLQAKIQKASFPNPSDRIDFYFLANAGMCIPSVVKNKNKQSLSARNSCLVL
ncbi:unnamed protein product [Urochloa humidicola]